MKSKNDFGQFRRKIFLRTIAVLAAAAAVIYLTYAVLLRGRFANGMVALFQNTLGMDYGAALRFYERTFRSHMDAIILLSLLLVAAGLFYCYLRWLTRYFEDISKGMDALLQDVAGEISLPPELLPIERKMNLAKHTIDRQKSDMLLAEQKKNDLVMYLAHDLKTPLASSISYLNLLRDEKQLSEELREKYLTIALAKSERLEDLINEFLEIARYSLSTITLQHSEINLTRLLEQLVYEFQPVLDQKGLTCRLAAGEDILLNCDADKMQRVFDNLLRNAVNYSYDGTEITIEAESGEDRVKAISLVAEYSEKPAGYINIYPNNTCGAFGGKGYPEIVDFGVLEKYRNQGIGTILMDIAEEIAETYADIVYLGVGLHSGYGSAQRMYVKRGYIPDGSGVWYQDKICKPNEECKNDDDLVLYLSKKLRGDKSEFKERQ